MISSPIVNNILIFGGFALYSFVRCAIIKFNETRRSEFYTRCIIFFQI